jgi:hypothetical protein
MTTPPDAPRNDPFYVGYLALPRAHRLFLLAAVPASLTLILAGAIGLALGQSPWGDGRWETAAEIRLEGVVSSAPYPVLHTTDADTGEPTQYLLVSSGKFGPDLGVTPLEDGAAFSLSGFLIERDGRRMLEVSEASPLEGARGATPSLLGAEPVVLRGEILDAKCYLGAMKPGIGRGHKACAMLCIEGGIPPVLLTIGADGSRRYHLLADETGAGLAGDRLDEILPLVAERVEVSGVESRVGGWRVLRITRDAVKAL